uniref:Uncharacterized protein n=1 Tax=Rhizophora mucronata TaxID=61149 RepID=A0A2P2KTN6_RHIMU
MYRHKHKHRHEVHIGMSDHEEKVKSSIIAFISETQWPSTSPVNVGRHFSI